MGIILIFSKLQVKQLDRYNLLKRNLVRPPVKDTVTIPDGGYTIVRFEAYNPGFWLFHCHIEFHAEIGMALVIKVGDNDEMLPVPKNFPSCHDYMPTGEEDESTNPIEDVKPKPPVTDMTGNGVKVKFHPPSLILALGLLLKMLLH